MSYTGMQVILLSYFGGQFLSLFRLESFDGLDHDVTIALR